MENREKVLLTDEDKITIDQLASYPRQWLANAARRCRKGSTENKETLLSIDDLNNEKLLDLLPKIDVYVSEIHQRRIEFGNYDEVWMIEYWSLKDSITSKLGINS